ILLEEPGGQLIEDLHTWARAMWGSCRGPGRARNFRPETPTMLCSYVQRFQKESPDEATDQLLRRLGGGLLAAGACLPLDCVKTHRGRPAVHRSQGEGTSHHRTRLSPRADREGEQGVVADPLRGSPARPG